MLLLILFAGCLATCAAQTTSFPSPFTTIADTTAAAFPLPTPATSMADSPEYVAILQASVQSLGELNVTTVTPVLDKLRELIEQELPSGLGITLAVKNITKV